MLAVHTQPGFVCGRNLEFMVTGFKGDTDFEALLTHVTKLASVQRRPVHGCDSLSRYFLDRPDTSSYQKIVVTPKETIDAMQVSNVLQTLDKSRSRMPYPGIGIRVVDIEEYGFPIFVPDVNENFVYVLVQPLVGRFEV